MSNPFSKNIEIKKKKQESEYIRELKEKYKIKAEVLREIEIEAEKRIAKTKEPIKCSYCDRIFNGKKALDEHEAQHPENPRVYWKGYWEWIDAERLEGREYDSYGRRI